MVRRKRLVAASVLCSLMLLFANSTYAAFTEVNANCFRPWLSSTLSWGGDASTDVPGSHTLNVRLTKAGVQQGFLSDSNAPWTVSSSTGGVSGGGVWQVTAWMDSVSETCVVN